MREQKLMAMRGLSYDVGALDARQIEGVVW